MEKKRKEEEEVESAYTLRSQLSDLDEIGMPFFIFFLFACVISFLKGG